MHIALLLNAGRCRVIELIGADLQRATTFTCAKGCLHFLSTLIVWVKLVVLL